MTYRISGLFFVFFVLLQACSPAHLISIQAKQDLLGQPDLQGAHVGISVYDPERRQYLYNYQGDRYFVPASNTKLFSLYAGMKYLGDSLSGVAYLENDTALFVIPAGDPSILHPDFARQPVIDLLKKVKKNIYLCDINWKEEPLGAGWSWDDYNDSYMAERSPMPLYGNVIHWVEEKQKQSNQDQDFAASPSVYSIPEIDWKVRFSADTLKKFHVQRSRDDNIYEITQGSEKYMVQDVPFVTHGLESALQLLRDTVGTHIYLVRRIPMPQTAGMKVIHTQPADSVFIPMMHYSNNFFAEQTLLMASWARLGYMNDAGIIDTLLATDLRGLPQKPSWVDGSGLSRYNLFTPQDFVWLLDHMMQTFGIQRMKTILPTGGQGTLSSYYKQDSGAIYAKTGSLSDVLALSGYLYTKKNRLLLFSIMVNNHQGHPGAIRKDFEKFLLALRNNN